MSSTFLPLIFFIVAMLYATVGFGGGSGYLAAMALLRLPPELMRPTALALNVLVSAIGSYKFYRAGHFSHRLFWPIAAASVPMAFLGGRLSLPSAAYKPIVGIILLYAALRLLPRRTQKAADTDTQRRIPLWLSISAGAVIGLMSGLVGVGGGIFLSPILLLTGMASTRQTMSISAAFILVNSLAGLAGLASSASSLPAQLPIWLAAVAAGGWIGAEYGSRRVDPNRLRRILVFVLALGGLRMIFS